MAILRDQEEECERLAGTLYTKGLTQEQVGEVFNDIYGEHYSKASISRMLDYLRRDVTEWLEPKSVIRHAESVSDWENEAFGHLARFCPHPVSRYAST